MLKDRHVFSVTQETRAKSDIHRKTFCLESSASLFILQFDICSIKNSRLKKKLSLKCNFKF